MLKIKILTVVKPPSLILSHTTTHPPLLPILTLSLSLLILLLEQVAIKILDKAKIQSSNMTSHLKSEIAIMRMIKHENIVEIKDVFASQSKIFMVLEYLEGYY